MNCTNIFIIVFTEGEEVKRKNIFSKKIFKEIVAENFVNMGKDMVPQIQEAQSPRPRRKC